MPRRSTATAIRFASTSPAAAATSRPSRTSCWWWWRPSMTRATTSWRARWTTPWTPSRGSSWISSGRREPGGVAPRRPPGHAALGGAGGALLPRRGADERAAAADAYRPPFRHRLCRPRVAGQALAGLPACAGPAASLRPDGALPGRLLRGHVLGGPPHHGALHGDPACQRAAAGLPAGAGPAGGEARLAAAGDPRPGGAGCPGPGRRRGVAAGWRAGLRSRRGGVLPRLHRHGLLSGAQPLGAGQRAAAGVGGGAHLLEPGGGRRADRPGRARRGAGGAAGGHDGPGSRPAGLSGALLQRAHLLADAAGHRGADAGGGHRLRLSGALRLHAAAVRAVAGPHRLGLAAGQPGRAAGYGAADAR